MSQGKVTEVKIVFAEDDANEMLKAGWDLFSVTYRGTGAALGLTMVKRAQPTAPVRRTAVAQTRTASTPRGAATTPRTGAARPASGAKPAPRRSAPPPTH